MSGKKISEMTAITGAQLDQTNDVVPVLDVSDTSNPNKKISIQELASVIGASGTTNVSLVLNGSNELVLTDSDANTVSADLSSLLDNTDTTNVSLSMNGNNLELTDSAANTISVDLSQFLDDTNTTNASLSLATNTLTLTDSATDSVSVDLSSLDNSTLSFQDVTANGQSSDQDLLLNSTGSLKLPIGTEAQRPITPANGMIRYNSDDDVFEGYAGGAWENISSQSSIISENGNNILSANSGNLTYNHGGTAVFDIRSSLVKFAPRTTIGSFASPTVTLDIQGTDAVQLTSGTTAQRPTAAAGMIRFNTTTSKFEGYDGTSWIDLN